MYSTVQGCGFARWRKNENTMGAFECSVSGGTYSTATWLRLGKNFVETCLKRQTEKRKWRSRTVNRCNQTRPHHLGQNMVQTGLKPKQNISKKDKNHNSSLSSKFSVKPCRPTMRCCMPLPRSREELAVDFSNTQVSHHFSFFSACGKANVLSVLQLHCLQAC